MARKKAEPMKVYVVQRLNEYGGGIIAVLSDPKKAKWVKDSNSKCVLHEFELSDDKVDMEKNHIPYFYIMMDSDGTISKIERRIFEESPKYKFFENFRQSGGKFFGEVEDTDGEDAAREWMEQQRRAWIADTFNIEVSDLIPS